MNETDDVRREYEIAFLVKEEPTIPDVLGMLKRNGAEISFEGAFKKIALSYEIAHELHAYFGYFHFSIPRDKIAALEKELRMSSDIMRFLIVTPPLRRGEKRATPTLKEAEASTVSREVPTKAGTLPLSNEELEKKIDEILK